MIEVKWSKDGLWYTKSHKGEQVNHFFRLGSTNFKELKIFEIIIWKLRVAWAF